MAIAPGRWLRQNLSVYFGNATAVRDYRVQLRGNKAVVLWGVYLLVMIGFGVFVYGSTASADRISVIEAQRNLRQFYDTIINLLGGIICLIAPALTATAVVSERQRRSLDLVFSAPVTPKYYLVGKMISSYRYVWMLLVLALPITSACVVLGGATWMDVLCTFILLSLLGLLYCAISILFSTIAPKPVSAIVWSYLACACYTLVISSLASYGTFAMMGSSGPTHELPFIVALSPFNVTRVSSSYSIISGVTVANWIIVAVYTLAICKLFLLAAASALSPLGAMDTKMLRLHGVVYAFLIVFALSGLFPAAPAGSSSAASTSMALAACVLLGWFTMPLVVLMPFLACFGNDSDRKFMSAGVFEPRKMFVGTPDGSLPYVLLLLGSAALGLILGLASHGIDVTNGTFVSTILWMIALWVFAWSLGRFTSGMNLGLRGARTAHFCLMLAIWFIPIPFLMIIEQNGPRGDKATLWDFYILRPIWGPPDATRAGVSALVLIITAFLIACVAENMRKKPRSS